MRQPALLLAALWLYGFPTSSMAIPASRFDPRLAGAMAAGAEPVAVWVEFADKGERGPADLALRLADAERALTPEARRRREKAHVLPIVDWLDLPLDPGYVRELRDLGYDVYGQSRWFNRVAVHASGERLAGLGTLPFVRHVTPVELAQPRERESALVAEPARDWAPRGRDRAVTSRRPLPLAAQVLYGQTFTQLARLNVPAVHDSGYIGTAINVCLLDDGFNWYRRHEALRLIPVGPRTRDFIRGVASVQDTESVESGNFRHGTATLSVLAGRMAGVYIAPAWGCNAVLGRTEDSGSEKPIEMVYWGMGAEWADSLGCDIISSSLGYNVFPDSAGTDITYPMLDGHTSIVTRAAEIAAAKGILVVVSAGNDGNNARVGRKIGAPADANGDSVIAIGAVDSLGVRASFSSKGPTFDGRIKPDLSAQGVDVLTAFPATEPDLYVYQSGTSFSAPLVAGLAACLMQARPTWPPVLIIEALKRTASRAGNPDTLLGFGIPDGLAALRYVPDTLGVPDLVGPLSLHLSGPNPLRASGPAASVRLSLGSGLPAARYRLRVLDAAGRVIRELATGTLSSGGTLAIPWHGDDARGRALVPGVYILALESEGRRDGVRVVVLR